MFNVRKLAGRSSKRAKRPAKIALTALEELIRVADKAQIPLIGGAFGVASEIVDRCHAVSDNQAACRALLQTTVKYTESVWEFIRAMSIDYITESTEYPAVAARNAILEFGKNLCRIDVLLRMIARQGRLKRVVMSASISRDVSACTEQLLECHRCFEASKTNIIVSQTRGFPAPEVDKDTHKIPGAHVIPYNQLKVIRRTSAASTSTFWVDTVEAKIENKTKVVKMYYAKSGGRKTFERDMEWMKQNIAPNLAPIYGYCGDASIPFVAFDITSVMPFRKHLCTLGAEGPSDSILVEVWKMLIDLQHAGSFIVENNVGVTFQTAYECLFHDPTVDDGGRVMLAMPYSFESDLDTELEACEANDIIGLMSNNYMFNSLNCRPFRILDYALTNHAADVLGADVEDLNLNPSKAISRLERWLPPCTRRQLLWPGEVEWPDNDGPQLGALGVFELHHATGERVWRSLTNIKDAIDTPDVVDWPTPFKDMYCEFWELRGQSRSRSDFYLNYVLDPPPPKQQAASQDHFWHSKHSPHVHDPTEEEKDCSWKDHYNAPYWDIMFRHPEKAWDYLRRNARDLAKAHGVSPEDLVLIIRARWHWASEYSCDIRETLVEPLHLNITVDTEHPHQSRAHLNEDAFDFTEKGKDMADLVSEAQIFCDERWYFQLETADIQE